MKRFILTACAGLLAAAVASPSFAADLPRPAYKAPVYVAPFSWSGFYVGINGGYGWGTSNWTIAGTGLSTGNFGINGGLSAAPSATTCKPGRGSGASKATSMPAGSRAPRPAGLRRAGLRNQQHLARNRARPHRLRLGSLAAVHHRRRGVWRHQDDARLWHDANEDEDRLDSRRRRRIRLHGRVVGQARISLCRSRQGDLQRGHLRRQIPTSTSRPTSFGSV